MSGGFASIDRHIQLCRQRTGHQARIAHGGKFQKRHPPVQLARKAPRNRQTESRFTDATVPRERDQTCFTRTIERDDARDFVFPANQLGRRDRQRPQIDTSFRLCRFGSNRFFHGCGRQLGPGGAEQKGAVAVGHLERGPLGVVDVYGAPAQEVAPFLARLGRLDGDIHQPLLIAGRLFWAALGIEQRNCLSQHRQRMFLSAGRRGYCHKIRKLGVGCRTFLERILH